MFEVEPNDIKSFVSKNGGRKEKAKVSKENIKTILQAKDEQDANTTCLCVSKKWSDFFTNYYIKHLQPFLPKLALWALSETVIMKRLVLLKTSLKPLTS